HRLEGEGRHVHVAILLHALGASAHSAPDAVLAIVAGLRVDGERQTSGFGQLVDRIKAAVAGVDAVDIHGKHGAHHSVLAVLDQPLQLLDRRRRVLAGDEAHALQALRVDWQILLQEPAIDGATQDSSQLLVPQAIDGQGYAGAEDDGDVYSLLVHIRKALASVPLTRPATLDMRRKRATDAWPQPLSPGGHTAFHIHPGGAMTIAETYGCPMMVLFGQPGSQIFPGSLQCPSASMTRSVCIEEPPCVHQSL